MLSRWAQATFQLTKRELGQSFGEMQEAIAALATAAEPQRARLADFEVIRTATPIGLLNVPPYISFAPEQLMKPMDAP